MVCDGPEPPDHSPQELSPPPVHNLVANAAEDSDEETNDYMGYEPLPQGPEGFIHERATRDEEMDYGEQEAAPVSNVPPIEPIDQVLSREVWNAPRPTDAIEMDNEKAQQVMTAMANFVLPQTSIPDWAKSISEEQWKETLSDRLEKLKNNP